MENFDMNNKDHIMALLRDLDEQQEKWIKYREEFTSLVSQFIVSRSPHKVVSCEIAIDTMNEHVNLTFEDGQKVEIFFKKIFLKNESRTSKLFSVTPIFSVDPSEDSNSEIVKPIHQLGERIELRVFKSGNKIFTRVNKNENLTMDMSDFPEEFEEVHPEGIGDLHPAVLVAGILVVIDCIR